MPCENLHWGYWVSKNTRGKKFLKVNPHPQNKRGQLVLDGEWYTDETGEKHCRKWTIEEINSGYGITRYGKVKLVPIPCNNCDQCRLQRANEWVTRIICEYQTNGKKGCKIDLTYNPDHVPDGYVLKKSDYQGFVRRLRTYLSRHDKNYTGFKYYIGGEYGETYGRPHYHIIIIGWEPSDLEQIGLSNTGYPMYRSSTIDQNWTTGKGKSKSNNGFATIEPLTVETISYATRYTNKKSGKAKINKGVHEFQAQSQRIGLEYWNLYKKDIKTDTGIWIKKKDKAKLVKIPRYFKKLWAEENPIEYEMYTDWEMLRMENIMKNELALTDKPLINYIKDKVESSKFIYQLLKRNSIETHQHANDNKSTKNHLTLNTA